MADNKVRAPCGKLKNPRQLKRHVALCTKCAELRGAGAGVPASLPSLVPMIDVRLEDQQPGATAPQIDQPPVNLAGSDPADDEDVVRRVVEKLAPSLNKQTEAIYALLAQIAANKPLRLEEQAAEIEKAVARQITQMVKAQRAAQAAKAGAVADASGNSAGMAGGGDGWSGLLNIIREAAPLFHKQAGSDTALSALAASIKGLSEIEGVILERYDGPRRQVRLDTLREVGLLAKLKGAQGLDEVVDAMRTETERTAPKPAPKTEPNAT